jgi:gluconate 2-dehydrogenase gamma chain
MDKVSRRVFLKAAGAAALVSGVEVTPAAEADKAKPAPRSKAGAASRSGTARPAYVFFNPAEAALLQAVVARLIPADASGAGALEAGVPEFIDKQLGGAWGAGERLYRAGPWQPGTPSQGYQLPYSPADLFRTAIRAINDEFAKRGKPFASLAAQEQDAYLDGLQKGKQDLGGVPANVFFDSLLAMTVEGFFSDPVYGGNKDMVSWKMIGFPGAYASYYEFVDQHGMAFDRPPMSLAQDGRGVIHVDPNIPAHLRHGEK